MVFHITVKTLFGESRIIEFFDDVSIFDLKEYVKAYFSLQQCDINLIHNTKNLVTGNLFTNNIKSDDIIYITLNMNSGFNLTEKYKMENILESYKEFQKKTTAKLEELESYFSEIQNTEKQESTPLEILGRMQMEKQLDEDSYKSEDMRILFQRCRNQIEEEYNKKKQTEKENEKIKRKLKELKNRMKMKKQKLNNIKPEIKKKETFCGFKKGFLL